MLTCENIGITFGGLKAVSQFSIHVPRQGLIGLIGPNGAGKTTVFNLITGVYKPDQGRIILDGKTIENLPPHEIARYGISRTFQNIRLFSELTVEENLLVSYHNQRSYGLWDVFLSTRRFHETETMWRKQSLALLEIFNLQSRKHDLAKNLSYGDQRRLEIIRALATSPKVLFLDEPAAGLNPQEKVELMNIIAKVRKNFSVAVVLIEHDMKLVMGICEKIFVLDHGEIIAFGTPQEVQDNPKVIEAYLGV